MGYRLLADLTLILHLLFILFVLFGGLLCLFRSYLWILHIPAACWGVWVEWQGIICPLTPLENHFRRQAFDQGYSGGFIEQYLLPLIYPAGLSSSIQLVLAGIVLASNILVYLYVGVQHKKSIQKVDE